MAKNNIKPKRLAPGKYVVGNDDIKSERVYLGRLFLTFEPEISLLRALRPSTGMFYAELKHLMMQGNHIYMNQTQLADHFQISRPVICAYLKELMENDVIVGSGSHYMLNPLFALNGEGKTKLEIHKQYALFKERLY